MDKTLEHYTEQAELAGYMRDALRYRWLRDHSTQPAEPWSTHSGPVSLDTAIDNAIAAMEKSK